MNQIDTAEVVLTHHARKVMRDRDVTFGEVLDVLRNYSVCEPHQGSRRFVKGDLVVVVCDAVKPVVVTVLWRKSRQWTSAQMRNR